MSRFAPGLVALMPYSRENLGPDIVAGLSVAAVALPVGVAYAELAEFSPAFVPVTMIDATGLQTTHEVSEELESRGIVLAAGGCGTEWQMWAESRRLDPAYRRTRFPAIKSAIQSYLGTVGTTAEHGHTAVAGRKESVSRA